MRARHLVPLIGFALTAALAAALVASVPHAASQDLPASPLVGDWWVETRPPSQVVGRLTFAQTNVAGEFDVSGLAMVRMPGRVANAEGCRAVELFDVEPIAQGSQPLVFGPSGQLAGSLLLTSREDPACQGTLRIVRGKDRVAFQRNSNGDLDTNRPVRRLTLRGRLTIGNSSVRRTVRLRGVAPSSTTLQRRWQGQSPNGRVRGTRIASRKFGVHLETSSELGFPFLDLDASGAVLLAGNRTTGVVLNGTLAVARSRRGLVRIDTADGSSTDLGSGWGRVRHHISSRFANPATYAGPLIYVRTLMTLDGQRARRVRISGQLDPL